MEEMVVFVVFFDFSVFRHEYDYNNHLAIERIVWCNDSMEHGITSHVVAYERPMHFHLLLV